MENKHTFTYALASTIVYINKYIKNLLHFAVVLILISCDMLEYHPYDCNISGAHGLTEKNVEAIELSEYSDTLKFAMITDTQRWYDDTYDAVKAINRRNDISFVIHCGDISDFGATKEFVWQRDILQKLRYPYVCIIGNHDFLGTGESAYRYIFGETDFAFTAAGTRFVCMNTNALEKEDAGHVPNFNFLENELNSLDADVKQTIVAIHAQPFSEQFNNNAMHRFHDKIKEFPNLLCILSGHGHSLRDKVLFDDGIRYIMAPCIHERCYLLFTVTDNYYNYEVCHF